MCVACLRKAIRQPQDLTEPCCFKKPPLDVLKVCGQARQARAHPRQHLLHDYASAFAIGDYGTALESQAWLDHIFNSSVPSDAFSQADVDLAGVLPLATIIILVEFPAAARMLALANLAVRRPIAMPVPRDRHQALPRAAIRLQGVCPQKARPNVTQPQVAVVALDYFGPRQVPESPRTVLDVCRAHDDADVLVAGDGLDVAHQLSVLRLLEVLHPGSG
mmetsp:Transcript_66802/g.186423  ORF Transcript_66802/g.186423 Transcript_66802/m.186423 type:complete len:219 (+) Transcript_66802:718-1374(+)